MASKMSQYGRMEDVNTSSDLSFAENLQISSTAHWVESRLGVECSQEKLSHMARDHS